MRDKTALCTLSFQISCSLITSPVSATPNDKYHGNRRGGSPHLQTAGKTSQLPRHWSGIVPKHLNSFPPPAIQFAREFISVWVDGVCVHVGVYPERVCVCVRVGVCLSVISRIFLVSGETSSNLCGFVSNYSTQPRITSRLCQRLRMQRVRPCHWRLSWVSLRQDNTAALPHFFLLFSLKLPLNDFKMDLKIRRRMEKRLLWLILGTHLPEGTS